MKTTLYLVSTLIEQYNEPTIKRKKTYANVSDAQIALDTEVEEGMKKFGDCNGELFFDMPNIYSWCDVNGNSLLVTIEEITK